MNLDTIIEPEIVNDALAEWLTNLASREDVRSILEIGSSDGRGSTSALVKGMGVCKNKHLYCIELSKRRYDALYARYHDVARMWFYWGCAVPKEQWMSEADVRTFYETVPTNLNAYPLDLVLGWLRQDVDYYDAHRPEIGCCGIEHLQDLIVAGRTFDLVLIDGSAFTAKAELDAVYGSKIIVLDDTLCVKNWHNWQRLRIDPNYKQLAYDPTLRNGYAIFERVK